MDLEPPTERGRGLTGSQFFQKVVRNEGVTFFRVEGCNFYIKNKLKSEIYNEKKSLWKICYVYVLKNKIGLRMKNFNIFGVLWKGGITKNHCIGGVLPKRGGFGQFAYLRGDLTRKRSWCFWEGGGVTTLMHPIPRYYFIALYQSYAFNHLFI